MPRAGHAPELGQHRLLKEAVAPVPPENGSDPVFVQLRVELAGISDDANAQEFAIVCSTAEFGVEE
ncbi:hypothetical protein D8B34_23860 [Verminephrobacter eiseniae]|nr:hypothetical protein [Verminephrobacter eiseniae]MCW5261010.1 hypothetical protein [Verminephrobacter eiseniae]MCW5295603.1 hypothetical protein [Verminephrobacter eiseniae]MCW8187342.1 hypothetical protein [Verminephrobacter eiseniae]MCW8225705.1 hypothetical protein [Verminephrobacter eiseniae]